MISLDSSRWSELEDAYGSADNIPALLKALESFPSSDGKNEPWYSLWSALYHQDDIFTASFAAVPHIIRVLASDPIRADFSFFQLPACIEIARAEQEFPVPDDLSVPYFQALQQLPMLVGAAASRSCDENLLCCALSAIAATKGFHSIAKATLELNTETAEQFMDWIEDQ